MQWTDEIIYFQDFEPKNNNITFFNFCTIETSVSFLLFCRSITYRINNVHSGRILVMASVVSVELELSTNELVLSPNYGLLHESGMRTTVRLYNRRNYTAQFSWIPVLTEEGMAFFIRPDGGS